MHQVNNRVHAEDRNNLLDSEETTHQNASTHGPAKLPQVLFLERLKSAQGDKRADPGKGHPLPKRAVVLERRMKSLSEGE
jgi:hypothetical protein